MNRRQLLTRALGAVASLSLYGPAAAALKPRACARPRTISGTVFIDEAASGAEVSLVQYIKLLEGSPQPQWWEAERRLSQAYHRWADGRPERQL